MAFNRLMYKYFSPFTNVKWAFPVRTQGAGQIFPTELSTDLFVRRVTPIRRAAPVGASVSITGPIALPDRTHP